MFWFRRDLRLADHPALAAATAAASTSGGRVLPVFILDTHLGARSGPNRLAMLYRCMRELESQGVPLVLRHGDPVVGIPNLCAETGINTVFATDDFAPYGRSRDRSTGAALAVDGRELTLLDSPYIVAPGTVLKADGTPFKVFTPFSKAWSSIAHGVVPVSAVAAARVAWHRGADSEPVPSDPPGVSAGLPSAGERAASQRLRDFVQGNLRAYDVLRNDPAVDATSRLSVDLKFGAMHPRTVLAAIAGETGDGARVFRSEICWREFYADVLWNSPQSARNNWNSAMDAMATDAGVQAEERFARWCAGMTGYPMVDAGMRQLLAEGWMHNRVRMIVASFLVKDLHLDWRWGARHFMRHLIDGDIASNQHGWQWTAGTGTDAAPYFRVFNPVSQGRKFDPTGAYVRRWVGELKDVDVETVHEPWLRGPETLFDGPSSYPVRIVDHAVERDDALARYAACRGRGPILDG